MNTYSLLNSVQAGEFNNTNRHIDFVYSAGGMLDLSQCFVQLVTRLKTDSGEVHNMVVVNSNGSVSVKNIDLIRNCWLSGDKVGKLEDITRVNILQTNLMEMTKSTSEKLCMIDSLYQPRDYQNGMLLSPFVEMHKIGSIGAFYRDVYLRIPLSQLFSLGSLTVLDTAKTGALRVHVELDTLSNLQVVEAQLFKNPAISGEGDCEDIQIATNLLTVSQPYLNIEQSPYFVGQRISISYAIPIPDPAPDPPAPPPPAVVGTIINILQDPISGNLTLTLDITLNSGNTTFSSIKISEVLETVAVDFRISNANLGICEVMGASMPGDVLEYTTFTVEQYSNNAKSLDKVFEVEGNAVNAMLMFTDGSSNLISQNSRVSSYRMRIDQTDVYDRDINVNYNDTSVLTHDPLHYDSINRTMLNAGLPLKNLTFLNMARDASATAGGVNALTMNLRFDNKPLAQLIVACPLPLTQMSKKVQFSVDTKLPNDTVQGVILYKQVVKSVKLSK